MTSMPHLPDINWNFDEQMRQADLDGGGNVYFTYDAGGQRVRKVHEHNGSTVEERIYLGGFEIYRRRNASRLQLERETLHVMDDQQRIAIVDTRTQGNDDAPRQLIRYQLGNHLGSACLELDEGAAVISYEEYHPYGTTSYQAGRSAAEVSLKRYRYTGKERDEETELNYHGARYFVPWLTRWCSVDPLYMQSGANLYRYVEASPVRKNDPQGTNGEDSLTLLERFRHFKRSASFAFRIASELGGLGSNETVAEKLNAQGQSRQQQEQANAEAGAESERQSRRKSGRQGGEPPDPEPESSERRRRRSERRQEKIPKARQERYRQEEHAKSRSKSRRQDNPALRDQPGSRGRRVRGGSAAAVAASVFVEIGLQNADVPSEDAAAIGAVAGGGPGVILHVASGVYDFAAAGTGLDLEARERSGAFRMTAAQRAELAEERREERELGHDAEELEAQTEGATIVDLWRAREEVNEERRQRAEEVREMAATGQDVISAPTSEISVGEWLRIRWRNMW